jgi:hypothetical protein
LSTQKFCVELEKHRHKNLQKYTFARFFFLSSKKSTKMKNELYDIIMYKFHQKRKKIK